jgi:hypothetical protein
MCCIRRRKDCAGPLAMCKVARFALGPTCECSKPGVVGEALQEHQEARCVERGTNHFLATKRGYDDDPKKIEGCGWS